MWWTKSSQCFFPSFSPVDLHDVFYPLGYYPYSLLNLQLTFYLTEQYLSRKCTEERLSMVEHTVQSEKKKGGEKEKHKKAQGQKNKHCADTPKFILYLQSMSKAGLALTSNFQYSTDHHIPENKLAVMLFCLTSSKKRSVHVHTRVCVCVCVCVCACVCTRMCMF